MVRTIALLAVLALASADVARAAESSAAPVLAQYSTQTQNPQQDNSRSSRRSNRGVVKLVIFGACLAIGVGGWVVKKVRGQ
jgi:hypothetical protein